jgi:cbb3-type cytochrome oxidase subunit 1
MSGFFLVLTAAGLVQGHSWLIGETVYRMLPAIHVYMVVRACIGVLILSGAAIGLYNIIRTLYGGGNKERTP